MLVLSRRLREAQGMDRSYFSFFCLVSRFFPPTSMGGGGWNLDGFLLEAERSNEHGPDDKRLCVVECQASPAPPTP